MNSYALYMAMRMADDARPPRCCSDDPPIRTSRYRPSAVVRWPMQLRLAISGSLRFARAMFREPSHLPAPSVGARVIRLDGTHVGHVREVFVSLRSGTRSLSIQPADAPEGRVILLPTTAVEPSGEPDVFVATGLGRSSDAA